MGINPTGVRAAILVTLLGLAVFGLFEVLGRGEGLGDLAFIALVVVPLIAYGIGSGMVQEFTAPGGWGAKFHEVARETVDPRPTTEAAGVDVEDLSIVTKGGPSTLMRQMRKPVPDRNVALTLTMGRRYSADWVQTYLSSLLSQGSGLSVVLLDDDNRHLASTSGPKLLTAMRADDGQTADDLIDAIALPAPEGLEQLGNLVALNRDTLSPDATNADALRKMVEADLQAMIVVGADGRLAGIVRRDDIIAKLLLKLTAD